MQVHLLFFLVVVVFQEQTPEDSAERSRIMLMQELQGFYWFLRVHVNTVLPQNHTTGQGEGGAGLTRERNKR